MGFWQRKINGDGKGGTRRPRALVAAATMINASQRTYREIPRAADWQGQLWAYYDVVPEFRFCVDWKSQAASRCTLYVGMMPDDDTGVPVPTDNETAQAVLDELGSLAARAEIVSRLVTHLTVPGESYLVGMDVPVDGDLAGRTVRRWLVASGEEFSASGDVLTVQLCDTGQKVELDPETSTVIRFWRKHPREAWLANSTSRAVLPVLKEIIDLGAHITASTESRLAGAGIFEISENSTLPDPTGEGGEEPLHEDPGMASLIEAMVTPIGDRESASAVVPILMRSPDAVVGKSKHYTFSTPLDAQVQPLRDAAIKRLALGMDVPPEVLLGMGESNHWNAEQISVDRVVIHVEPDMIMICQMLTDDVLIPALSALGVADPGQYVVWFDSSELTQKPDRSEVALDLWEKGLLSDDACLRECGFSPEDKPDEAEAARRLLVKLATAGVDPAVIAPYLSILAAGKLEIPAPAPAPAVPPPAIDAEATPALPPAPEPGTEGLSRQEWQIRTLELGVVCALERVGRRILGDPGGRALRGQNAGPVWTLHAHPAVKTFNAGHALDGAYAVLDAVLDDQPRVRQVVAEYVAALLEARVPHERGYLVTALRRAGCLLEDPEVRRAVAA